MSTCKACGNSGEAKCVWPDGTEWMWADDAHTLCCGCTFDSGYMSDGSSGRPVLVTMSDLARVRWRQDKLLRDRPELVAELPVSATDLAARAYPLLEKRIKELLARPKSRRGRSKPKGGAS